MTFRIKRINNFAVVDSKQKTKGNADNHILNDSPCIFSEYTSKNDADRHVHSGNSNYAHKDEIEHSSSYTKTKGGRSYGKKEDLRDRITGIPPEREKSIWNCFLFVFFLVA